MKKSLKSLRKQDLQPSPDPNRPASVSPLMDSGWSGPSSHPPLQDQKEKDEEEGKGRKNQFRHESGPINIVPLLAGLRWEIWFSDVRVRSHHPLSRICRSRPQSSLEFMRLGDTRNRFNSGAGKGRTTIP